MNVEKNVRTTAVAGAGQVSHGGHVSPGDLGNRDEWELAAMGKKQVLRRNFGIWQILGLSLSCTVTWEGILIVFLYGLVDGGPAGLVYGYIFCWLGYGAIIASMGELASMAPTASGQYHWVHMFAPPKWKNILSYVTGWQTVIAWQATVASGSYLAATMLQGLVVLNYPDYDFQRWHGTLIIYAVMLVVVFVNTVLARYLPMVEYGILIIHLCGFVGILVPLVYFAPHGTADDVFKQFLTDGGYSNKAVTFLVGIISATFAFLGADAAVHMTEEIHNATTVVPWVMVSSIGLNGTLGFGMLIAVLFCAGDITAALTTPTGYPFIEIFTQALQSAHKGTAMASFILAMTFMAVISCFAAASRMTWAFARDNGLPGSSLLGRVEPRSKLPLWSMGLTTLVPMLLALINIGSSAAFNAVISLVVSGFLGSYLLPVGLLIWMRTFKRSTIRYGPWRIPGWAALPVNLFGMAWCVVAMLFSFFPAFLPVTPSTMNWSCVLYGGITILAVIFWFVDGKKRYKGPIIETDLAEQIA